MSEIEDEIKYDLVTESESFDLLKKYPNKVERDVKYFCEPPVVAYYDWTLGNSDESMIAYRWTGVKPGESSFMIPMPEEFYVRRDELNSFRNSSD